MERRRIDWNKYGPPFRGKKKKRGNRRGSSRGPRIEIHARLIPAYFGLSQSFLPRSPLLPGANYVKSTSRDNTYARRVHVAGTEISKVSGQCRSIDKTGRGGPFSFIPFFFFFSFFFTRLEIFLLGTSGWEFLFRISFFYFFIRYFDLGDEWKETENNIKVIFKILNVFLLLKNIKWMNQRWEWS